MNIWAANPWQGAVPAASARLAACSLLCAGLAVSGPVQAHDGAASDSAAARVEAPSFTVSGEVKGVKAFDLKSLQALPQATQTVGGVTYAGVGLWTLLNGAVGLVANPKVKNDALRKYVVATGSDGYKCVFSLAELDPAFGHPPVLIAVTADGAPLGARGMAELVVPGDGKPARWVTNLVTLEVLGAGSAPEPASR